MGTSDHQSSDKGSHHIEAGESFLLILFVILTEPHFFLIPRVANQELYWREGAWFSRADTKHKRNNGSIATAREGHGPICADQPISGSR
jgi:hypothetical protein